MRPGRKALAFASALCLMMAPAGASEEQGQKEAAEEQAFNEAIMDFGELAGNAYACLEGDAQAEHEKLTLSIYHKINELFGSNRAFRFSTRYGFGAAAEPKREDCETIVIDFNNNYAAAVAKHSNINSGD